MAGSINLQHESTIYLSDIKFSMLMCLFKQI
jgi:hypothetical protein